MGMTFDICRFETRQYEGKDEVWAIQEDSPYQIHVSNSSAYRLMGEIHEIVFQEPMDYGGTYKGEHLKHAAELLAKQYAKHAKLYNDLDPEDNYLVTRYQVLSAMFDRAVIEGKGISFG